MHNAAQQFDRLIEIMNDLREKCPWDKKQTIHTLRSMTIEEMYELADAITNDDWDNIKEEVGDLLLHIVFYAKIAEEENKFTLQQSIEMLCDKLIKRHPHIYGDVFVKDEEEVKQNWEKIKMKDADKTLLGGVPVSLPALVKAMRIQEKARQVGFEWEKKEDVLLKVKEEMEELQHAIAENNQKNIEEEFGDVLFSLVNYARFLRVDAEEALERTNKKFIKRFNRMEKIAADKGTHLSSLTLGQMDELWNSIKKENVIDTGN